MSSSLQPYGPPDHVASVLASVFGHARLTPVQAAALPVVLAGHDALVVAPTGGGKSLCYQLPALAEPAPALTVVVSPLVAVMTDQVAALRARGAPAAAVHAGQAAGEARSVLHAAARGQLRLLYVSPERLVGSSDLRRALAGLPIRRVVVDEAHCVVRWGRDFRPDYLGLATAIAAFGRPQLVAVTATATRREQSDILHALGRPGARRVAVGFDRPELYFAVSPAPTWDAKLRAVVGAARRAPGPLLVYTATRHEAERLARALARGFGLPAACYHAGLARPVRAAVQAGFMADRVRVVAATCAFGLGVDKADVRAVVQWSPPPSLTDYLQAAGRAGRDGAPALALMLWSDDDRRWRQAALAEPAPTMADLGLACLALDGTAAPAASTLEAVAQRAGLSPRRARDALGLLRRAGIARPVGGDGGAWIAVRPPSASELAALAEEAGDRRAAGLADFGDVVRYATGDGCRRAALAASFGAAQPLARADCCDACGRVASVGPAQARRTRPRARPGSAGDARRRRARPPAARPRRARSRGDGGRARDAGGAGPCGVARAAARRAAGGAPRRAGGARAARRAPARRRRPWRRSGAVGADPPRAGAAGRVARRPRPHGAGTAAHRN